MISVSNLLGHTQAETTNLSIAGLILAIHTSLMADLETLAPTPDTANFITHVTFLPPLVSTKLIFN